MDTVTASKAEASRGPVVVALGYGASGPGLVRAAAALARYGGSELECLTVDTGARRSSEERERLIAAQELARSSGARMVTEAGLDLAPTIAKYVAIRGASALVVGSGRGRLLSRNLQDSLARSGCAAPIVAIRCPDEGGGKRHQIGETPLAPGTQWIAAAAIIALVTVLNQPLANYAGYWAASILYLAAIGLMALFLDRLPVLVAAILSAAAWDFLFIPPKFTLAISKTEDLLMLCLYFIVAIAFSALTGRLRQSARLLASRQTRLTKLSALAHELAGAKPLSEVLARGIEAVEKACEAKATVILKDSGGELKPEAESGWEPLDADAWAAARLCLAEGRETGRFSEYFPDSQWHFVSLEGPRCRLGVLGVRLPADRPWDKESEELLRALVATLSIAVAREER